MFAERRVFAGFKASRKKGAWCLVHSCVVYVAAAGCDYRCGRWEGRRIGKPWLGGEEEQGMGESAVGLELGRLCLLCALLP